MNLASARQSPLAVRTAMLGPVEAPPLATRRVLIAMHVSPQVSKQYLQIAAQSLRVDLALRYVVLCERDGHCRP